MASEERSHQIVLKTCVVLWSFLCLATVNGIGFHRKGVLERPKRDEVGLPDFIPDFNSMFKPASCAKNANGECKNIKKDLCAPAPGTKYDRHVKKCVSRVAAGAKCDDKSYYVLCDDSSLCHVDRCKMTNGQKCGSIPCYPTLSCVDGVCVDWLDQKCKGNSSCPMLSLSKAMCFKERCSCAAGYFFSKKSASCVRECEEPDLLSEYTEHPGAYIFMYNIGKVILNVTAEQCKAKCSAEKKCRSAVFYFSRVPALRRCFLKSVTALEANPINVGLYSPIGYVSLFQKKCAQTTIQSST